MEYYKEYPIRCKSCNEQIACYSDEYEQLLDQGKTIEEALNLIGIMQPCSRTAMMNPVIVFYNMENRDIVEGIKNVRAVDLDKEFIREALEVPLPPKTRQRRIGLTTGRPLLPSVRPSPRAPIETKLKPIETKVKPLEPVTQMSLIETGKFEEPETPGVPTINQDPIMKRTIINVGSGKQCYLLNGRTYLAR